MSNILVPRSRASVSFGHVVGDRLDETEGSGGSSFGMPISYCHQCLLFRLFLAGLSEELNRRQNGNEIMQINASDFTVSDPSWLIFRC